MKKGEYTPEGFPEITIKFTEVEPRQIGTRDQPRLGPHIEIDDILIRGAESEIVMPDNFYIAFINTSLFEGWHKEIVDKINREGR